MCYQDNGARCGPPPPSPPRQTRAVLDAIAEPDDELTASAATRYRLEGAALALDVISRG